MILYISSLFIILLIALLALGVYYFLKKYDRIMNILDEIRNFKDNIFEDTNELITDINNFLEQLSNANMIDNALLIAFNNIKNDYKICKDKNELIRITREALLFFKDIKIQLENNDMEINEEIITKINMLIKKTNIDISDINNKIQEYNMILNKNKLIKSITLFSEKEKIKLSLDF